MRSLFEKARILNSIEAEKGADRLIEKVESEMLKMDVLPNSYSRFTGELEESDYLSYCRFIKCANGKNVLSLLEAEDAKDVIEL